MRLWIVLTVLGVPAASCVEFEQQAAVWDEADTRIIKQCVDTKYDSGGKRDALKCTSAQGTDQSIYQREGTTLAAYWGSSLLLFLLADLLITALVVGL